MRATKNENIFFTESTCLQCRFCSSLEEEYLEFRPMIKHCSSNIENLLVEQNVWPLGHVKKHCFPNIVFLVRSKNVVELFSKRCATQLVIACQAIFCDVAKRSNTNFKENLEFLTNNVWLGYALCVFIITKLSFKKSLF